MNEKNNFIGSDITFKGVEAKYLIDIEEYFESLKSSNKPKYTVLMTCAHLGLKLSDKERRETVEIEEKYDESIENYYRLSYHVPRTVLLPNELNIKRFLFLIATVDNRDNLDVNDLQKVWNNPKLSRAEGYGYAFYQYTLNGAKYLLLLLQIRKLNADQVNEAIFEILSRDIEKIVLKSQEVKIKEFVADESKLLNVDEFEI